VTTAASPALADLGREPFVSLTTFRRSGVPVSTPVWVARDGDTLVVTTPSTSGKVKRIRHSPRVQLTPCSRTGKVAEGALPADGVAEVVEDPSVCHRLTALIRRKYPMEFRVVMLVERLVARRRSPRVIVRIALPG
jgi:PPOX class probable F420-dependent enzyme